MEEISKGNLPSEVENNFKGKIAKHEDNMLIFQPMRFTRV